MPLLTVGLNHNTAPVHLRERTIFGPEHLDDALSDLVKIGVVDEATILSTCNRTELYCQQSGSSHGDLIEWLCAYQDLSTSDIQRCIYHHPDQGAVKHAFRVASGLDSMVLGEPQILGQMKQAFAAAQQNGATGKILNRLFQQTFSVAKQVRTDTDIGTSAVSVAYAAIELARQIFSSLGEQTVLFIGAGETIELAALHFQQNRVKHIIVANRTESRAQVLADRVGGEAITLATIPERLQQADIVVASTASTLPILGKGAVERALRQRKHNPMFLVDLAVPRDIEAEVAELDDAFLYTVDDLMEVVTDNLANRRQAADEAEKIIDLEVVQFMRWLNALDAVPMIRSMRSNLQQISEQELDRAQRRLAKGDDPSAVLERLANAITNKFSHAPSEALKQAGHEGNRGLLSAAKKIFAIKDE